MVFTFSWLLLFSAILFFYLMGVILHAVKLIFFQADPSKFGTRWRRATSAKTLIVMGSGGHTAEMVELLSGMDFNHFSPRIYVIAETDETSSQRVRQLETIRKTDTREHDVLFISRSREVHQSWSSTIITTTESLIQSFIILYRENVDLILVNGPGTCVPICLASFIMKVCWIRCSTVVFIESICRVKSLSLTGRFMQFLADCCIVQWPDLKLKYPRSVYLGRLV